MGTWGSGIYENDSTRDYIDGIIDNISNAVRDIVKWDYTLLHAGMPQSDLFMCYIDLLNAICSRHDLHTSLPDAEVVRKWKAKYMEVWEFTVGECDPAEDYRSVCRPCPTRNPIPGKNLRARPHGDSRIGHYRKTTLRPMPEVALFWNV